MIQLKYCTIEPKHWGCVTRFEGGKEVSAIPHYDMHHYHVIAHRCGYGDNLTQYCIEHEFAHEFVWENLFGIPSVVLHSLAFKKPISDEAAAIEEMAAQQFQRWLRANERPIIGGPDWDKLKMDAIALLDTRVA